MQLKPLISVVLPTYNRKELISRAIVSVLEQSYSNIELIVIDDGSNDGTDEILQGFTSDPRFYYFKQKNQGQSVARNYAIELSSGELIAFLDSDNYWDKDKLKKQLYFRNANCGYDILYSNTIIVNEKGKQLNRDNAKRYSGFILNKLVLTNFITNNTVLVPKLCFEELGGFNESLRIAEDYELWLRFATRYTFLHHPDQVTYYCCEGDRLSMQEEQNIQVNIQILRHFFQKYSKHVSLCLRRKAMGNLFIWQIESYWNQGKRPKLKNIIHAMKYNPLDSKVWRHLLKYLLTDR